MTSAPETHTHAGGSKPLLSFVPAGIPRTTVEMLVAAVPGTLLQFVFVLAAAGLNIWSTGTNPNEGSYALVYLPVVCLLPLAVGVISTLMYERVQGTTSAKLKGSLITAAIAGFVGTLMGAAVILIAGFGLKAKPFGGGLTDVTLLVALPLVMVAISTVLAVLGAAIVVGILRKMEK